MSWYRLLPVTISYSRQNTQPGALFNVLPPGSISLHLPSGMLQKGTVALQHPLLDFEPSLHQLWNYKWSHSTTAHVLIIKLLLYILQRSQTQWTKALFTGQIFSLPLAPILDQPSAGVLAGWVSWDSILLPPPHDSPFWRHLWSPPSRHFHHHHTQLQSFSVISRLLSKAMHHSQPWHTLKAQRSKYDYIDFISKNKVLRQQ